MTYFCYIYEQALAEEHPEVVFGGKEVMLKVITFIDADVNEESKLSLIEAVSKATNQQTSVVEADRRSNDKVQVELQKSIYNDFGYFYERKKGEFYDGLKNHYIENDKIIDREVLLRIGFAINGSPDAARRTSAKLLFSKDSFQEALPTADPYRELMFGYFTFTLLQKIEKQFHGDKNNRYGSVNYGSALRYGKYAVVYVTKAIHWKPVKSQQIEELVEREITSVLDKWLLFEDFARTNRANGIYFRKTVDEETGVETLEANF